MLVGYPCFRLRITGHYFALLTLALTEFVRLLHRRPARLHRRLARHPAARATATASRSTPCSSSPTACSSYYICFALWLLGLYIWLRVDRQHGPLRARCRQPGRGCGRQRRHRRDAREAEDHRALGRACARWAAPSSRSTRCISGPTRSPASASRSTSCSPSSPAACGCCWGRRSAPCSRRCWRRACASPSRARPSCSTHFGNSALALDQMIYGLLLVLFIIYMPKGILGTGTRLVAPLAHEDAGPGGQTPCARERDLTRRLRQGV